jgi:hypothetical protein
MQRALLWAGIDAAKILGRAPLINACLTEPLLFLFGGVDRALLRFAHEPNYAPRFNCLKLCVDLTLSCLEILDDVHYVLAARRTRGSVNQTQIIFLALSKQCERAFESAANGSARMWISANRALWSPNGVLNRSAR